ncbi:glycosyltransferase [Thomasclavelia cocleata]|uniref:glycosyltransferase n=1 Tax=Thomasclavelia cocleata TaxID=69824 RepID=UPI00256EFFB4|nr:glycosyltransferase [Thomasclavelia cocleata]
MDILLVLDNLSGKCGANVKIALELAEEWSTHGNRIYCLTRIDNERQVDHEKEKYVDEIFTFVAQEDYDLTLFIKNNEWNKLRNLKKIQLMIFNPMIFLKMMDKKFFASSAIRKRYKTNIKKVCFENRIDAVVAVTEPFYIAMALSSAKIRAYKYWIMLDPYTNNSALPNYLKIIRKIWEKKVFRRMEKVFALDFVWRDIDYLNRNLLKKAYAFHLPKIAVGQESLMIKPKSEKNEIVFAYIGQFYNNIRNPEFMLQLFSKLPSNYYLYIYGGGSEEIVDKYKVILGKRLVCFGWVNSDMAERALDNADILVNLNNSVSNLLPSKLLEYINTGKPLLNISKIAECPSLEYTNKYPLCLNICESRITEEMIDSVVKFTKDTYKKVVAHKEIEKLYSDCTCQFISKDILNYIVK